MPAVNPRQPPSPPTAPPTSAPGAATAPQSPAPVVAAPVTHYENFPVASLLCPPHLRQPITAIYAFARTADDIADEGDATPAQRLADLAAYRVELTRVAAGQPPAAQWAAVFGPLQAVLRNHALPVTLLDDLLSAFIQDVQKTRDAQEIGRASCRERV